MPPADDAEPAMQAEPVRRRGLTWPLWVCGLIGALAVILYVFVIAAR